MKCKPCTRAKINMVVCAKALLNVVRKMQDTYGQPFFEGSFYGVQGMSNALHDFARMIGDPDLMARIRTSGCMMEAATLGGIQQKMIETLGELVQVLPSSHMPVEA